MRLLPGHVSALSDALRVNRYCDVSFVGTQNEGAGKGLHCEWGIVSHFSRLFFERRMCCKCFFLAASTHRTPL